MLLVEGQREWTCDYKHGPVDFHCSFGLDLSTLALDILANSLEKK